MRTWALPLVPASRRGRKCPFVFRRTLVTRGSHVQRRRRRGWEAGGYPGELQRTTGEPQLCVVTHTRP
jgi:hypothetical protein